MARTAEDSGHTDGSGRGRSRKIRSKPISRVTSRVPGTAEGIPLSRWPAIESDADEVIAVSHEERRFDLLPRCDPTVGTLAFATGNARFNRILGSALDFWRQVAEGPERGTRKTRGGAWTEGACGQTSGRQPEGIPHGQTLVECRCEGPTNGGWRGFGWFFERSRRRGSGSALRQAAPWPESEESCG
jgi:hypothetical protein